MRQKGNNPDRQLRSPKCIAKWETMSECTDNQEVGLEAAILERVRNSSLVKCSGADNVTGLKLCHRSCGLQAVQAVEW